MREAGVPAVIPELRESRYGYRGIVVGEASHPGPASLPADSGVVAGGARHPASARAARLALEGPLRAYVLQPVQSARAAVSFIVELAPRTSPWPADGSLPRRLVTQKWSPVLVPILWAATQQQPTHPIIDWLEAEYGELCQGFW